MAGSSFTKYQKSISLPLSAHWPEKKEGETGVGHSTNKKGKF
jgi:hypothetical protein